MTPLLSGGDAIGILIILTLWISFIVLLGVWIGARISRRK